MEWNEEKLNELLTTPSEALIRDVSEIGGDIMILGAGGKMGGDLAILARKAMDAAGLKANVFAVSRFSDEASRTRLLEAGVKVLPCDLSDRKALEELPECRNIVFMAGRKFGTTGQEYLTWSANTYLPFMVAERFRNARIVVFSTGNIYPKVSPATGGATEETPTAPVGEYVMSCQGRERAFEYAAKTFGTSVCIMRLNYAVDLRYGVLHDISDRILKGEAVNLSAMPSFNCIWQKDANEAAIRLILSATPDVSIMNVTGPETAGVRDTALKLGRLFGKEVVFEGEEAPTAYLSNANRMCSLLGYPTVSLNTLIEWQAEWILSGGRSLNKPTHFEEREGKY